MLDGDFIKHVKTVPVAVGNAVLFSFLLKLQNVIFMYYPFHNVPAACAGDYEYTRCQEQ